MAAQTGPWPITADVQPTPRHWYAATKVFLEAAGSAYSTAHGMSVLAVRLGWCPRTPEQCARDRQHRMGARRLSDPGDAGRFFAGTVEAPADIRFAVLYATSRPEKRWTYDLGPAHELLGYEPQDTWPQGVEGMTATFSEKHDS